MAKQSQMKNVKKSKYASNHEPCILHSGSLELNETKTVDNQNPSCKNCVVFFKMPFVCRRESPVKSYNFVKIFLVPPYFLKCTGDTANRLKLTLGSE